MALSSKEPEKRGMTSGGMGGSLVQDLWSIEMAKKLYTASSVSGNMASERQKSSQPFNDGAESYLHGVLAAMCAGHCKLKDIYKQVDQESTHTKIVAGFETQSKRYVLVPIELPFQGSMIPDDWFLELKARIVMECGE